MTIAITAHVAAMGVEMGPIKERNGVRGQFLRQGKHGKPTYM